MCGVCGVVVWWCDCGRKGGLSPLKPTWLAICIPRHTAQETYVSVQNSCSWVGRRCCLSGRYRIMR